MLYIAPGRLANISIGANPLGGAYIDGNRE